MAHIAMSPSLSDVTASAIAIAARGNEITGLAIYDKTLDDYSPTRFDALASEMYADQPIGGTDFTYGAKSTQHLRFWSATSSLDKSRTSPLIIFVHGGSWRAGTNLDSIGSVKVNYLTDKGYAFVSINYTLIPEVTVAEQVQEIADSIGYLVKSASELDLGFDPTRLVLMGHSSGAHVVTLLGTDTSYLAKARVDISSVLGVISLDGSNYNAMAEIADNPGPIADNMMFGLGRDPEGLIVMSPTYHAHGQNAKAFLLLHVQRLGDIRQAVELSTALRAAGTDVALHVFEGAGFEGHIQMLLRIGDPTYPATLVMDRWLEAHVPVL